MQRREFLQQSGLLLGTAGLLPGVGLAASELFPLTPDVPEEEARKLIWDAAYNRQWEAVKRWLERDPSLIGVVDLFDETLLHYAVRCGYNTGVEFLQCLVSYGADVNAKTDEGRTPLHYAAIRHYGGLRCNVEKIQYLVAQGAEVNAKDVEGWTPLHFAARRNHVDVLKCLISAGADVWAKNDEGETPLDIASRLLLVHEDTEEEKRINRERIRLAEEKKRILREAMGL